MGGSSPQKTVQKQKQKNKEKTKTVTKTVQATQQQTGPYGPTTAPIQGLISAQQGIPGATSTTPTAGQNWAVQGLTQNAQNAANQYNPQQQQLINDLYAGGGTGQGNQFVTDAGQTLQSYLSPDYIDPNKNQYLAPALTALSDKVKNDVSNQFALAGRDFSGNFSSALGKGYAQSLAPLLLGQYNALVGQQQGAAGQMPGISSALDASALNRLNARMAAPGQIGALNDPYNLQLLTEQARAGLPYTNLSAASQFLLPIAQLGNTGSSSSTGSTNSAGTTTGTQNLFGTTTMTPANNPMQTAIGAGLGGLGLLSMGSTGGLGGLLGTALGNAFV